MRSPREEGADAAEARTRTMTCAAERSATALDHGRGEERTALKVRVGDKVTGTVNNLADFGAFITIAPGQDALHFED